MHGTLVFGKSKPNINRHVYPTRAVINKSPMAISVFCFIVIYIVLSFCYHFLCLLLIITAHNGTKTLTYFCFRVD